MNAYQVLANISCPGCGRPLLFEGLCDECESKGFEFNSEEEEEEEVEKPIYNKSKLISKFSFLCTFMKDDVNDFPKLQHEATKTLLEISALIHSTKNETDAVECNKVMDKYINKFVPF